MCGSTRRCPNGRKECSTLSGGRLSGSAASVKKGFSYGATDEYDLYATLLALMGLHHESLTYRCAGRYFRLTDVAGNIAREIFE